jgi:thymidylate kinase
VSERGKYIVFEGGDGVGKSTVMHGIAERLRDQKGLEVITLEEPDSAIETF